MLDAKDKNTLKKKQTKQNKIYLQDEGSLILQYKGQMDPCQPQQGAQTRN